MGLSNDGLAVARYWSDSGLPACPLDGRKRGQTGRAADIAKGRGWPIADIGEDAADFRYWPLADLLSAGSNVRFLRDKADIGLS
jgi:hypothetical protein